LEKASWDNTKALLDAVGVDDFSDEPIILSVPVLQAEVPEEDEPTVSEPQTSDEDISGNESATFFHTLSDLEREVLFGLMDNLTQDALDTLCMTQFLLTDAVFDQINEKAVDYFGDILLDNGQILDEYREFLIEQRKEYI